MSDLLEAPPTEAPQALVVIPATLLPTIIAADANDILGNLSRKVAAFRADVSTAKGRAEMRSLAAEIASGKMDLIRLGKSLTEGWREQTKAVNAECKIIEERMDALRDRVRQQLTDYENAEKARVAGHEAALAAIVEAPGYGQTEAASELRDRLHHLQNQPPRDWQEFAQRAADTLAGEIARTEVLIVAADRREAEAAELARLRAEQAERERLEAERQQAEREAAIAAEAAERARQQAEAKAAEEREAIERRAREAADAAEAERAAAARREQDAKDRADRAERDRIAAEERAEAERQATAARVERDRVAAAEQAERDRLAAVEAERKRAAEAKAAEEAETKRREANVAHRKQINGKARDALVTTGLTVDQATDAVRAIAKGEVPHVSIAY